MRRGGAKPHPQNSLIHLLRHLPQRTYVANDFLPPFFLLAGDVGRADDALVRVDEEESENLAVARFGGIDEVEGSNTVLEDLQSDVSRGFTKGNGIEALVDALRMVRRNLGVAPKSGNLVPRAVFGYFDGVTYIGKSEKSTGLEQLG